MLDSLELHIQEIMALAAPYIDSYDTQYCEFEKMSQTYEFSIGGLTIPRGYYCPSPIYDIVVGNAKRGKLLRKKSNKMKADYCYGFSAQGKLITVCKEQTHKEFIICDGGKELGIGFSYDRENGCMVEDITFCTSDGDRIQSFSYGTYDNEMCSIFDLWKEDYVYTAGQLTAVNVQQFFKWKNQSIHTKSVYRFQHDADGFLSGYTIDNCDYSEAGDKSINAHIYPVDIKRKI